MEITTMLSIPRIISKVVRVTRAIQICGSLSQSKALSPKFFYGKAKPAKVN
jgi:hypothetical protein